ncbi:3-keto-disaccharide hydrolase [Albibacterium profundi]|uniref:DUF1080 domain-containing protein n=1 Tax=Albibacterium profundi TaxID=3134906 RepID=A0ABV5CFL9_9SPHI
MKKIVLLLAVAITAVSCASISNTKKSDELQWESLFNGKDLNDWVVKINKHEVNDNFANTFRVEDGLLTVSYDGYENFDEKYGHIAYKKPYSYYLLRIEYRFHGDQVAGGPGWAFRNSGAMLHGQDPFTMLKNQDFPISIEGQFLGGDGTNERSTSNLCTPGTNVVLDGELYTPHCVNSSSETFHGDQWVQAEFLVLGDSIVHHIVEGDTVLTYEKPQIGGGGVDFFDEKVKEDGKLLSSGYIYLQSESHPVDFRKVEILDLEPYKNNPEKMNEILAKVREQKQ